MTRALISAVNQQSVMISERGSPHICGSFELFRKLRFSQLRQIKKVLNEITINILYCLHTLSGRIKPPIEAVYSLRSYL